MLKRREELATENTEEYREEKNVLPQRHKEHKEEIKNENEKREESIH